MYIWISCMHWLAWGIITKVVLGGCGREDDNGKKKEKSSCWYELWYFWVIVALFVVGATVIIFFYCKQQAKNTRLQNAAGRNRYPQMFLPPPPPSYETPGHQPPPYHIAISVHFQEVRACDSVRDFERHHQTRDTDNFMEVEEVTDHIAPRAESVPPPYSLTTEINSAERTQYESVNFRATGSSTNELPLYSSNNFLTLSSSSLSQYPPAYSQTQIPSDPTLEQNNFSFQDTTRTCIVHSTLTQSSALSSSSPTSATTSISSSALATNDIRPQSRALHRGITLVSHVTTTNQSVLRGNDTSSRRLSNVLLENNSNEDTTQRPVTVSSVISTNSRVTNSSCTPVSTCISFTQEQPSSNSGRFDGISDFNQRNNKNAGKRNSLGAIRYANNLARSQDQTNGTGQGERSRRCSLPSGRRLPTRSSRISPREGRS